MCHHCGPVVSLVLLSLLIPFPPNCHPPAPSSSFPCHLPHLPHCCLLSPTYCHFSCHWSTNQPPHKQVLARVEVGVPSFAMVGVVVVIPIVVPPPNHSTSSCSWGWGWVVCHYPLQGWCCGGWSLSPSSCCCCCSTNHPLYEQLLMRLEACGELSVVVVVMVVMVVVCHVPSPSLGLWCLG